MIQSNISNYSNNSNLEICLIEQDFQNLWDFCECFILVYIYNLPIAILGTCLVVGIVAANFGLIIYKLTRRKISIYDQIIIGNCIVDGLTGIVDVPFFLIAYIFGYWPFGKALSLYWASYDNNINTTTALHMLYMIYVTIRHMKAPNSYKKEILIRKPYIVMASIWAIGLTIWIPITLSFGTIDFTESVNFRPVYLQTIINFFSWFLIDMIILISTIYIVIMLNKKNKKIHNQQNDMVPNLINNSAFPKKDFKIASLIRFFISFVIQWIVPCLLILIDPLCMCVSKETNSIIYWLTFTVCFTERNQLQQAEK